MDLKDFFTSNNGNYEIRNRNFTGQSFTDFVAWPQIGSKILIENVKFIDCKLTEGSARIGPGVVLKNIIFQNFACGNFIQISTSASLQQLVFMGQVPNTVVIRPEENISRLEDYKDVDFCVDIEQYNGEVSIIGLPLNKIKINSEYHIKIDSKAFDTINWSNLGISPISFWGIAIKKIKITGSVGGVFSFPKKNTSYYKKFLNELQILNSEGILSI